MMDYSTGLTVMSIMDMWWSFKVKLYQDWLSIGEEPVMGRKWVVLQLKGLFLVLASKDLKKKRSTHTYSILQIDAHFYPLHCTAKKKKKRTEIFSARLDIFRHYNIFPECFLSWQVVCITDIWLWLKRRTDMQTYTKQKRIHYTQTQYNNRQQGSTRVSAGQGQQPWTDRYFFSFLPGEKRWEMMGQNGQSARKNRNGRGKEDRKRWKMIDNARMSPPSLSVPSLQSVSMTTLHPGPLHPGWQMQRQPFCSRVQRPCPLHNPGQPSEKEWPHKHTAMNIVSFWQQDVAAKYQNTIFSKNKLPFTTTSKSWVTVRKKKKTCGEKNHNFTLSWILK